MKFDASVNTLISEIMSNNSSAVMLCAPAGTGKTDLITELASRYRTVFWLNALSPDISCFASYLCDKIVEDNDEFKDKLSQLLRCKSVYHGETVVLTALLDYVSRIKGNCLMVFERAESLPPDFKLENIERLIKHCPPNLKIVISSDRFINFDYRKFEPLCPKLVDENSFTIHDTINFDEYIENLSDKDKAFLAYISDLSTARVDFADYIYPADSQQHGGKELLSYLSRKEGFVAIRDNDFHINSLFAKYLSQVKDKYPNFFGEFAEIAVAKRYADYIFKVKREFSSVALRLYAELGDLDMINEAVKFLCHCQKDIWRSYDIVKSLRIDELKPFHSEEYVFYNFLCGLSLGILKSYEECKRVFKEVYFQFKEKGLIWPAILCLHQLLRIPNADDNEFKEECVEMFLKHGKEEPIYFDFLFTATVRYRKDLELTMSDILNTIDQRGEKKSPTYILMKEHLAYYYFDISNYKKAIELAEEIHAYTPYYTVPHNFIAFKYYAGDVDEAKKSAEEALSFAEENEIGQDTGLLYGTLAMIDAYHGRINEALTKYDLSVKADIKDSPAQLFNVGQRCLAYAQHKDANYAKDVSHIYL
ncbi:MAG: hypothetical protein FWD49_07460 [Firmicutes bacterium]|nr:hypothetical protein [Bacillota bacterium]